MLRTNPHARVDAVHVGLDIHSLYVSSAPSWLEKTYHLQDSMFNKVVINVPSACTILKNCHLVNRLFLKLNMTFGRELVVFAYDTPSMFGKVSVTCLKVV